MKKITLLASLLAVVFCFVSCKHDPIEKFLGTWGVERIEYYYIDYAGNPIPNTMDVHEFPLADAYDGIDLIFRSDKTGEMLRRDIDTFYVQISLVPEEYDTIINADSTWVIPFVYSYDDDAAVLYMTMQDDMRTFMLKINSYTENAFTYINEYNLDKVEKAYLKRLNTSKRTERSVSKPSYRSRKPGSFLSF